MTFHDKNQRLAQLSKDSPVVLELGCGASKKHPAAIGVDVADYPCVDVCGDVFEVLDSMPDASVSACYSYHFLEHVADTRGLLLRLERVVQPRGVLSFAVPHFSNPYFYSDPTHAKFFGLYSMSYFCTDRLLRRRVPHYDKPIGFDLVDVRLVFKSDRSFPVRRAAKALFTGLVNSSTWIKEFYEELMCHWLPCYEIEFRLVRAEQAT